MGSQKPRILPWLVSVLDAGLFEGVAWLDASRTRFRIPWKHGLRQDAQQEDFGIFLAWAMVSGAYTPGKDKPDLPTCKRNFRAALNRKEELQVVKDLSRDPQDPHKIYEFVNSGVECPAEAFPVPDSQESIVGLLDGMMLAPPGNDGASNVAVAVAGAEPPQILLSPNSAASVPCPVSGNPLSRLLVPKDSEWEFEVTAFYRGRQVFHQAAFYPGGLRLVAAEAAEDALPGQQVVLPDPELFLTDRGAVDYVRKVLGSLGPGLRLWRAGQQLWAQRLGHCGTFWALGEELLPDTGQGQEGEVPKERERSVLDLQPYLQELIDFINGSGRSPRYTLWFCIGESWPQNRPWTKRLVMIKVVPTCLRCLLEMARNGGASSLENTVDLHISNSLPISLSSEEYKAFLQDLMEEMEF
ncbi:interferon regulatory factor 3 isoform X1 [Erinaceus europaeus]|uniref:Interferon regulatory factor 3 isoform X1 n=2 Tax=Erinaceus europaeus TaxID=9365 RepID=A0ABM3W1W0_ERIEU|nr:interferon regulatory factor 3 isoform X1 [Erinaceus europaeus]